jgi:predicted PurR-regulated permease PerM
VTVFRGSGPRWVWALAGVFLAGIALYVVGSALYALRSALMPVLFAFAIAYLLDPVVDRFEARRIPRPVAIVLLLLLLPAVLTLAAVVLLPSIVREVATFTRELPQHLTDLLHRAEPWLAARGVALPHSFDELVALVREHAAAPSSGVSENQLGALAGRVVRWIWGGTASVLSVTATLLVVPVFAFYLLDDFDRIKLAVRDLVPWRYRAQVVELATEVDHVLGQFVRGQLLVMLILGSLYALAYSIVGIKLAVPVGILAGLLSFIPYVGGATALVLGLLMCALGFDGWGQVLGVLVGYGVIQLLEGFVITPRLLGDKVGLSPVWVLVALLLGGELFGFLGVLLALPTAAVCKIFVVRAVAAYRGSAVFLDGAPAATVGGASPLGEAATDAVQPEDGAERNDVERELGAALVQDAIPPEGVEAQPTAGGGAREADVTATALAGAGEATPDVAASDEETSRETGEATPSGGGRESS